MTSLNLISVPRSRSLLDVARVRPSSVGAGNEATVVDRRLESMRALLSGPAANLSNFRRTGPAPTNLPDKLRDRLSSFKRMIATVAMHLDPEWRKTLFATLERLLDPDDWAEDFDLPSEASFSTFLRMIVYLHPTKRPGIGIAANGRVVVSWRRGEDRIVIECLELDEVRWVLSRFLEGERESGAGQTQLHRIPDVTAAYDPDPLFTDADKVLA